nr:O-antigen polysaccharide polymerase Wzy [Gracilibacillus halotolerans]
MYKKTFKYFFFTLVNFFLLIIIYFLFVITSSNFENVENWSFIISITAIILMFFQILQMYYRRIRYMDFRVWFIILLYLFMFGRVFLHAFNLDSDVFWDLMSRYPEKLLFETSFYILLFIQAIYTGLMLSSNFHLRERRELSDENDDQGDSKLLYNSGIILLFFSVPFRLYIDLNSIIQAQSSSSYMAIQQHVGLADDFAILVVPSILLILAGLPKNKRLGFIVLIATVSYFIIIMILTGDRRYPVTGILAILLCYGAIYRIKLSLRKSLLTILVAMILLNLLAVIRKVRTDSLTSLFSFFGIFKEELFSMDVIYETLAEFGLSFFSVVAILKHMPSSESYLYGLTFVGSFTSLVPAGFLFSDFHSLISPSSNTINKLEGYPVGATLAGDLYANFGWYAVLIAIIIGKLLSKLFVFKEGKNKNFYIVRYYSLFYILINLVRSSFFEIFRASFMVYFIPILIIMILKYRQTKQKNKS